MKMKIVPCTYKTASDFINRHHRHHNAPQGCKFCIALKPSVHDTTICGVAVCGRPVSRYLDNGLTCEITRVCTDGTKNACSMLYSACCKVAKAMGYTDVITYTLASENGASLKASNFTCEGVAGGTHWTGERNRSQPLPAELKTRWRKKV